MSKKYAFLSMMVFGALAGCSDSEASRATLCAEPFGLYVLEGRSGTGSCEDFWRGGRYTDSAALMGGGDLRFFSTSDCTNDVRWSEDDCSLSWRVECRVTRPDGVAGVETHDGVAWQVRDGDDDLYEGYDLVDAAFEGEERCAMSYDLRLYRP